MDCRSSWRVGQYAGQLDGCFGRDDLGFRCVRKAPASEETSELAERSEPVEAGPGEEQG